MRPQLFFGSGTLSNLPNVVQGWAPRRILVVVSSRRRRAIDLERLLPAGEICFFSHFTVNPRFEHILSAVQWRERLNADLVIGVGGGSALDVAKAARVLPPERALAHRWLAHFPRTSRITHPHLILIPTTGGSGSEITRFATIFVEGDKSSLDDESVRADVALVDPTLAASCPPDVTTAGALDALSHAIESWWSRRATSSSAEHARMALRTLVPMLREGATDLHADARVRLAQAGLNAGRAIDQTRTTAAHAFAYPLTVRFGVPHGVACALNLQWVSQYNVQFGDMKVQERLSAIAEALGVTIADVPQLVRTFLITNGWSPQLRDYGLALADLDDLVPLGMKAKSRAENNPVPLRPDRIRRALAGIY